MNVLACMAYSQPAHISVPPETDVTWTSPKEFWVHSNMGAVKGAPVDIMTRKLSNDATLTVKGQFRLK